MANPKLTKRAKGVTPPPSREISGTRSTPSPVSAAITRPPTPTSASSLNVSSRNRPAVPSMQVQGRTRPPVAEVTNTGNRTIPPPISVSVGERERSRPAIITPPSSSSRNIVGGSGIGELSKRQRVMRKVGASATLRLSEV